VLALLRRLVAATGGTFSLVPREVLETQQYAVAIVHWSAERKGTRAEGDEIAVYRIRGGRIVEACSSQRSPTRPRHDVVFSLAGD
jgi:hypothetical protein